MRRSSAALRPLLGAIALLALIWAAAAQDASDVAVAGAQTTIADPSPIGVRMVLENGDEHGELSELQAKVLLYFSEPVTGLRADAFRVDTNADSLTLQITDIVSLGTTPDLQGRIYRIMCVPRSGTNMAQVMRDIGLYSLVTYTIDLRAGVLSPPNEPAHLTTRINLMAFSRSMAASNYARRLAEGTEDEDEFGAQLEFERSEDTVSVVAEFQVHQTLPQQPAELGMPGEGAPTGDARQLGYVSTCEVLDGYDFLGGWTTHERRALYVNRGGFNVHDDWMCNECRGYGPCQSFAGFVRNDRISFWLFYLTVAYQRVDLYNNKFAGNYFTYWSAGPRYDGSLSCGAAKSVRNAHPTWGGSSEIQQSYGWQCDGGYVNVNGVYSLRCATAGGGQAQWVGTDPLCYWLCPTFGVTNGNPGCNGYLQGATCWSNCFTGFSRHHGDWTRNCIERQNWNNQPLSCIKNCDPVTAPRYGWANTPRPYWADVAFTGCQAHYAAIGGLSTHLCQSTFWTNTPTVCEWDCYNPPPWTYTPVAPMAPTYGSITNRLAETRCSAPWWEQTTGLLVSQCQFQRSWSRPSGQETCTMSCGRPWTPDGGKTDCTGHLQGDKCTQKCLDSLVYTGGEKTQICSNQQWVGGAPTCLHQCPKPQIFGFGKYSCSTFFEGGVCKFECLPGYGVTQGITTRTCKDYDWTASSVACQPLCGNGRVDPANGEECDDGNSMSADGCTVKCRKLKDTTPLSVLIKSTSAQLTGARLEADFQFLDVFAAAKRDANDITHSVPLQRTRAYATELETPFVVASYTDSSFETFFKAADLEPMLPRSISRIRLVFREVPHIWDTVVSGNSTTSILNLA